MPAQTFNLWLCEECDAAIPVQPLQPGEKAYCPNCHHKIAERNRYALYVPLAFSITGLLLLFPACMLPLMHMQMLTSVTNHSIISGVSAFIHQEMWIPAILILLGAVISPFIYLTISTFVFFCVTLKIYNRFLMKMLWVFNHIRYWGMLEVYLLGIVIAIIKLGDVAKVYPGIGLMALIGLIFCQAIIAFITKPLTLWNTVEMLRNSRQGNGDDT